jgi:hypothetical protein
MATIKHAWRFLFIMMSDLPCVSHPLFKLGKGSNRCMEIQEEERLST